MNLFGGTEESSSSFIDKNQAPLLSQYYGQLPGTYAQGIDPQTAQQLQGGLGELTPAVMEGLLSTTRGDYLPGGEAFNTQMDAIGRFIQPQLASQFGTAGRFGSGLHKIGFGQAMADAGTGLYQQERDRQMNTLSNAPGIYNNMSQTAYGQPYAGLDAYKQRIGTPTILQQSQSETSDGGMADAAAMAASIYMMSDRRLKTNIKQIDELKNGLPIYSFDYIWGEHAVGAMADEVEKIDPSAVAIHSSGYKMVDYSKVLSWA